MTRPCKCGLARRTKRLCGFAGTAGGEPSSTAVFKTKGLTVSRASATGHRWLFDEIQGIFDRAPEAGFLHSAVLRTASVGMTGKDDGAAEGES